MTYSQRVSARFPLSAAIAFVIALIAALLTLRQPPLLVRPHRIPHLVAGRHRHHRLRLGRDAARINRREEHHRPVTGSPVTPG
ncbi:hypothetical protein QP028_04480 [Corynebacterium suedekumii]|nr:hypothetical protein QP028_04480 [Corynebacterium suedekumii]